VALEETCFHCGTDLQISTETTFLGFKKFTCPVCGKENKHVLRNGYRWVYYIVLFLSVAGVVNGLAQGDVPRAGIVSILAMVALGKDYASRRKMRSSSRNG
jgi:predicted RNA-binding Zn-ribbon protein involved in translation (DUF1610 family)